MTTATTTDFTALTTQFNDGVEHRLQGAAMLNDVTAQLIDLLRVALTNRDHQAIRDIDRFMVTVMWDCDDWTIEPEGVIHLMRFYDQIFCAHQLDQAERALRGD